MFENSCTVKHWTQEAGKFPLWIAKLFVLSHVTGNRMLQRPWSGERETMETRPPGTHYFYYKKLRMENLCLISLFIILYIIVTTVETCITYVHTITPVSNVVSRNNEPPFTTLLANLIPLAVISLFIYAHFFVVRLTSFHNNIFFIQYD